MLIGTLLLELIDLQTLDPLQQASVETLLNGIVGSFQRRSALRCLGCFLKQSSS